MNQYKKIRFFAITLLFLTVCLHVGIVSAQESQKLFSMDPVSNEAFNIILQSYEYDSGIPLNVEITEKSEINDCTREKFAIDGMHDKRVPGFLAFPKSGNGPFPCIILLHGHTGNKGEWWQDDSFYKGGLVSKAFLSAGYAVLALDAEYHGERSPGEESLKPRALHNQGWYNRSVDMIIQSVTEYRRAVDYLETRPEIDSARIGVHGYSMGGMMAFLLAGTEPRIKVTVSCVTWNWDNPTGKYQLIAPYNFARAVGNRPFLMMMGSSDPLLPVEAARRLYSLVETPSTELIMFDSDHQLPVEYIDKSLNWFQTHL